jgi:hypothetical protein
MVTRIKKNAPALKHGGYSADALLPGEDRAAFEKLHRVLIAELVPDGTLEEDTVASIARLLWRKQNLATFSNAELARNRCSAITQEVEQEAGIGYYKRDKLEAQQAAEAQARKELGETYELVEIGGEATLDRLMKELDIHDRLDAMIDRCLKRLLFVRGLKSLAPPAETVSPAEKQLVHQV